MSVALSLLPVVLFLTCLFLLDSFKLVGVGWLFGGILWGGFSALIAYYVNESVKTELSLNFELFTRYAAPVIEEILKSFMIVFLVLRKKVGFSVDAAIYGFAAGTGFALAENIVYLYYIGMDEPLILWFIRGFGTAVMHGGCSAILGILLLNMVQKKETATGGYFLGLMVAAVIHSLFNHFLLNPYLQTLMIFILLPAFFAVVFQRSTASLQGWLEIEFSNEVEILLMIRQGRFSDTKAGSFLNSLKSHFEAETMVDLYNYISLYLELSVKSKRNLMLRENGFDPVPETGLREKLAELEALRKQIGKTGQLAISPIIRINYRELWKLNQIVAK